MELIVPDDKLSLAIGKKGQNVRLASQLTGWKIDIHSESKVREQEDHAKRAMATLRGVGPDLAETLFRLGWRSAADLAEEKNVDELATVPGLGGGEAAQRIIAEARAFVEDERKRAAAQRELAARRARMSDDDKLRELEGVSDKLLADLKDHGYTTVDLLAHEQDIEKLTAAGVPAKKAEKLRWSARVWLGEVPADAPPPTGGGAEGAAATQTDDGWA